VVVAPSAGGVSVRGGAAVLGAASAVRMNVRGAF
jgi:hypothetical protein